MVTFERIVSTEELVSILLWFMNKRSCEVMTESINLAEKFGTTGKKNQAGNIGEIVPVRVPRVRKFFVAYFVGKGDKTSNLGDVENA